MILCEIYNYTLTAFKKFFYSPKTLHIAKTPPTDKLTIGAKFAGSAAELFGGGGIAAARDPGGGSAGATHRQRPGPG